MIPIVAGQDLHSLGRKICVTKTLLLPRPFSFPVSQSLFLFLSTFLYFLSSLPLLVRTGAQPPRQEETGEPNRRQWDTTVPQVIVSSIMKLTPLFPASVCCLWGPVLVVRGQPGNYQPAVCAEFNFEDCGNGRYREEWQEQSEPLTKSSATAY